MRPIQLSAATFLLSLALLLTGCGNRSVLRSDHPTTGGILDERAAAEAISRYRARYGLGPVTLDSRLLRAASLQADANARAGRLSHEIAGSFDSRMASAGFGKRYASENLSAGSETFDQVLARWKASPEHNRNMLMPQLNRIGIARADVPTSRYQHFWALVMAAE